MKKKKYSFRNYGEYIRDNPKKLWFKRRLYGWGWVPATWQGLLVILIFIAILILNGLYLSYRTMSRDPTILDLSIFLGVIVVEIILIFLICYKKGEKPKWSWGQ